MAGPTHKFFIDDSGNKEYSIDGRYGSMGGRTPYFVFGGLLISPSDASLVDYAMRTLKRDTFGTEGVEIKANWLKRREERVKRYVDKYSITEAALKAFVDGVYNIINETECQLIACAVNKAEVQKYYKDSPHYPPSIAYDCLLQRAQQEMASCVGEVHVTIDSMSGATPAGNQHLDNLRKQHESLKRRGSALQKGMTFDRIGGIAFRDSKHDERLQLADLVAYAVYRQFVDHGPDWEDPSKPLPVYEYLERIATKFRNQQGRIQGYGIIKFPMGRRVPWAVSE
jgi:hypothetical protein